MRLLVVLLAAVVLAAVTGTASAAPKPEVSNETLVVHVNRAKANGWAKLFTTIERRYGLQRGVLLAIASRETNMSDVVGDGGHGRGLFQIDDRYHRRWLCNHKACEDGKTPPVGYAADYAGRLLAGLKKQLRKRGVPAGKVWKVATSAYNAGLTGALNGYKQGNSDLFTANRNYGRDVQARRRVIVRILGWQAGTPRQGLVRVPLIQMDARRIVDGHGGQTPVRIVLHSTEGDDGLSYLWAIGNYWRPRGYGCQIAVSREGSTARYLDDTEIGWCVASYNTGTLSIEQAGFARFTRAQWMKRKVQLDTVARWIAWWSKRWGIPIRHNVVRGVLTHYDATRYKRVSGGHTDPGSGYPLDYVLKLARTYAQKGW